MSTTLPTTTLPPTARDFFVYELVMIGQASTRKAAAEAHISQTRVRQIIGKVLDWLAETLPAKTTLQAESQLFVARHIAADRLEAFYRDAKRKFDATDQCKYANLVLRVLATQSKLPAVAGHYEALMANVLEASAPSDSRAGGNADSRAVGNALRGVPCPADSPPIANNPSPTSDSGPAPPPVEGCSPSNAIPDPPPTSTTPESNVTPSASEPSAALSPRTKSARRAFFSPAHPPTPSATAGPSPTSDSITELKLTPQSPGISMQQPLTRQQRRRLRRAQLANK